MLLGPSWVKPAFALPENRWLFVEKMAKGVSFKPPNKAIAAKMEDAKTTPKGIDQSKEPRSFKEKEKKATLLGLRMLGSPSVAV